jgi:hypothetical protein
MISNYKVITLCGSTKFKDEFIKTQKELTLQGYIVISVGLFGHSGDNEVWTENTKIMLDDMHKRKIDMADEIFVINKGGYIGSSTRSEIEYAIANGKVVSYLEDTNKPKCNHKYPNGNYAIEYSSIYEMRENDVYCKICGREGTRKELIGENND